MNLSSFDWLQVYRCDIPVKKYSCAKSNDSVYARIGRVDSGENMIGQSIKMAALCQKLVDTFPKLG